MSQDVFSKCVALKINSDIDTNKLFDALYDYLDVTYGSYVYSVHFGKDFIALYHDQEFNDRYGITRIGITTNLTELYEILVALCMKHEIAVDLVPKYFTDFWYNGVDCSVVYIGWDEL